MFAKHTPGPWRIDKYIDDGKVWKISIEPSIAYIVLASGPDNPRHNGESNAARIVSCVNALEGIPDPEEFVAAAKESLKGCKIALDEGHSQTGCDAVKGPEGENWFVEEECNCYIKTLKDIITRAEIAFGLINEVRP